MLDMPAGKEYAVIVMAGSRKHLYHKPSYRSGGANLQQACHDNTGAVSPCKITKYEDDGITPVQEVVVTKFKSNISKETALPKIIKCKKGKCAACNDTKSSRHKHHVTYNPKKIAYLCIRCHQVITSINKIKADNLKRKLSNGDRINIFNSFVKKSRMKHDYSFHAKHGEQLFSVFTAINDGEKLTNEFKSICFE